MTTDLSQFALDVVSYPEWRDSIVAAEACGEALPGKPRSYPGYPRWPLDRVRPRVWGSLDRVLAHRRCLRKLSTALPRRRVLSRLLQAGHGITGPLSVGPVPSAGGFQALELYLVVFATGWLPAGLYHYDRAGHHLSQLAAGAERSDWERRVPSLRTIGGSALVWVLVGDGWRVSRKYGERSTLFLIQEAGHLMQNLCLRLVVLHKSVGQKFFGARAERVPGIGQIVAALQADPQGLGSGMVFRTVNETT
jgi:SagB-type dehydrogenase family enzyme